MTALPEHTVKHWHGINGWRQESALYDTTHATDAAWALG
jgi:hypothetical protein